MGYVWPMVSPKQAWRLIFLKINAIFRTHICKEHLKKVSRRLLHKYFFRGISLIKLMSFTKKTLNAFFFFQF